MKSLSRRLKFDAGQTSNESPSNTKRNLKGESTPGEPLAPSHVAVGAAALMAILGYGGLIAFLDRFGQRDCAAPAQVIVVLAGGLEKVREHEGVPSLCQVRRTLQAVELYQRGLAPKILCTGGLGPAPHSEASSAARLAMERGVPADDILVEDQSRNTWENVRNAAGICRAHGWEQVIVVSDPYHLWRVQRNFAAFGLKVLPSPTGNREWRVRLQATARESLAVARDAVFRR